MRGNIDYKAEVLKVYPNAGCGLLKAIAPDKTIDSVKYLIQRDSNMNFTDCEEDEDFLTYMISPYPTSELDAWKQAYEKMK